MDLPRIQVVIASTKEPIPEIDEEIHDKEAEVESSFRFRGI
jgi:hypothetical protein